MNDIQDNESSENSSENNKPDPQELPKKHLKSVLQELEFMALSKAENNTFNIAALDKDQQNKLIDLLSENEKNSFNFYTKRIEPIKEIELKKIDASAINQKTVKIVTIGGSLIILPTISLLILFFKDTFFIPWLTFLIGIFGGFGLSKAFSGFFKQHDSKNFINDNEII